MKHKEKNLCALTLNDSEFSILESKRISVNNVIGKSINAKKDICCSTAYSIKLEIELIKSEKNCSLCTASLIGVSVKANARLLGKTNNSNENITITLGNS